MRFIGLIFGQEEQDPNNLSPPIVQPPLAPQIESIPTPPLVEELPPLDKKYREGREYFLTSSQSNLTDLYLIETGAELDVNRSEAYNAYKKVVLGMSDEQLAQETRKQVKQVVAKLTTFSFPKDDTRSDAKQRISWLRDKTYSLARELFSLDCPEDVTEQEASAVLRQRIAADIMQSSPALVDAVSFISTTLASNKRFHKLMVNNQEVNGAIMGALTNLPEQHPEGLKLNVANDVLDILLIVANHDIPLQNINVEGLEALLIGGVDLLRILPPFDSMSSAFMYSLKDAFAAITDNFLRHGHIDTAVTLVSQLNVLTGGFAIDEHAVLVKGDETKGVGLQARFMERYYESLVYHIAQHRNTFTNDQVPVIREHILGQLHPRFINHETARYLWLMPESFTPLPMKLEYVESALAGLIARYSDQEEEFYRFLFESNNIPNEVKIAIKSKANDIARLSEYSTQGSYAQEHIQKILLIINSVN